MNKIMYKIVSVNSLISNAFIWNSYSYRKNVSETINISMSQTYGCKITSFISLGISSFTSIANVEIRITLLAT